MPTSFLCALHFPLNVEKAETASRLSRAWPVLEAYGLEPFGFAQEAWQQGTPRIFGATTLLHPAFKARASDPLWGAGFMFVPAPEAEANVVTMTTPARPLGSENDAWHWLTHLAEPLCAAVGAELGLINGFAVRPRGPSVGGTPAHSGVAPGHPPHVLCPWMYWNSGRLASDFVYEGLRRADAARSSPSPDGGWVLQPHSDYSSALPRETLQACATAWNVPDLEWVGVA